jgi:DeoR family fructose operon transcriptional repressor
MGFQDRKALILKHIKENGIVSTKKIMEAFGVSDMTVRRDLELLEQEGLLIKKFGGAVPNDYNSKMFRFDEKLLLNREKKEMICKLAVAEIKDNDVIFIDCGTTLFYLSKFLNCFENLRVITNSLPLLSELSASLKIKTTLLGGEYDTDRKATYGIFTEKMIEEVHCNKAFISADGISISDGLSSYQEKEANVTLKMIESSNQVFVLADSSKIEKVGYIKFASLKKVTAIITDNSVNQESIMLYKKAKINMKY